MKKKLAFVYDHIQIGGAGKVFLDILRAIDKARYEITVFSVSIVPEYLEQFPSQVRVSWLRDMDAGSRIRDDLRHFRVGPVLKGAWTRFLIHLRKDEFDKLLLSQRLYPKLPGRFDCAIAFVSNYQSVAVAMERVEAEKKAAWIHIALEEGIEASPFYQRMDELDGIFCVSRLSKDRLDRACPRLKDKTRVLYNLVDTERIEQRASDPLPIPMERPAIVTVGRLSEEKGQDMIPKVAHLLQESGHETFWYLIGDGPLRPKVEEEIRKYGMEHRVILLGIKENPYPYMKNCDIYVQTSYSEGWCLTTQEARILRRPIVTTGLPVMREQFIDGHNGLIVDGVSAEALSEGIRTLLERPDLQRSFIDALAHGSIDNASQLKKLYDFIEN